MDKENKENSQGFYEAFQESLMIKVSKLLLQVSNDERSLVLISHGFIEMLIDELIRQKTENSKKIIENGSLFPHSVKLLILHEKGVLSDYRYRTLDVFRKTRNSAAHEPIFNLKLEQISQRINSNTCDTNSNAISTDSAYSLCSSMLVNLWNDYPKEFSHKFF